MPKIIKPKSKISKSLPAKLAKDIFDDEPNPKSKVKAVKTKAKVKTKVKTKVKAKPATAKKTTRKVRTVRTVRAKKVAVAIKPVKTKFTKAGLLAHLAAHADVDKKVAKLILEGLTQVMVGSIAPKGAGTFVFPGLFKIITKKVAARKGGKLVMNRFSGEMVKQKAKAASVRVKIRPMAGLKAAALV
jgi:Bacterial DNA-binding protein